MSRDDPHWSATNTYTFKEIWVEPVSRFLGAVSVYTTYSPEQVLEESIQLQTETAQKDKEAVKIMITATGTGVHKIEFKSFNAKTNFDKKQIDLSENKSEKMELELSSIDPNMPYIVVISVDQDPHMQREIVGSFVNTSFSVDAE
jgi:hypothetical protein